MSEATSAERWFAAYSADHQHPLNQQLHTICVPAIVWSLTALLYAIPTGTGIDGLVSWVFGAAALVFWWLQMPRGVAIAVTVFMALVYGLTIWLQATWGSGGLVLAGTLVFVVAWIGQFVGHHYEGKRPSFFTDLVYLLIGPPWVLVKLYRGAST